MLTLGHAALLLLAPLSWLAIAAAARRSAAELGPGRRAIALGLRALSILLLTLALSRPVLTRIEVRPFLTVFAADVSDSVPARAWEEGLARLRAEWDAAIAEGHRCALVAFGGRAEVLVPPTDQPLAVDPARLAHRAALARLSIEAERSPPAAAEMDTIRQWKERIQTSATDLGRGVDAARALFSDAFENRIVLFTDGVDTLRGARTLNLPAGARVARLEGAPRNDVAVAGLQSPVVVRTGEPFDVRVAVDTTGPAEFTLSVTIDDVTRPEPAARFRVAGPGRHTVLLENVQQKELLMPGLHRLGVMARAEGDLEPRNNAAGAVVTVTGKPRVLLVEGAAGEGEAPARWLRAQEFEVVRGRPGRIASADLSLEEFAAVILCGVPRESLPPTGVRALAQYVEASGGGLWVIGSPALEGARGYAKTPFEELLPVAFTGDLQGGGGGGPASGPPSSSRAPAAGTPKRVLAPSVALLLLVDKSGSMAGSNIALVKEACIESAKTLSAKDFVGVLAFDFDFKWVLPFTEADRRQFIEDRILRLYADGGTHIHPALVEAHRIFQADPRAREAGIKHAILLSDGDTQPADFDTIVRSLATAGVTVSTVCVGSAPKFDAHLMKQIAALGRGRFFFTGSFRQVPQIFVEETRKILRAAEPDEKAGPDLDPDPPPAAPGPAPERPLLAVRVRDEHDVLQGLDRSALPGVRGGLVAAAKSGASVPLVTPDGRPILALWRRGLGKAAVWTPDLSPRWSAPWLAWPGSGKLFAQVVRHISNAMPDEELAARVRVSAGSDRAVVTVDGGGPEERITATDALTREPLPVTLSPDGSRAVTIPLPATGEVRRLLIQKGDGKGLLVGAFRAVEPEFAPRDPGSDLFSRPVAELESAAAGARMGAERRSDVSVWLLLAALLILPLDVAIRRVRR